MKYPKLIACFLIPSLLAGTALAAEHYVSPSGDDTHDGSLAQPWLTLTHAVSAMAGGDTTYIRAGNYAGAGYRNINPKSGTPSSYTTFQGYPGDALPVIDCQGTPDDGMLRDATQTGVFRIGGIANQAYIRIAGLHLKGGGGNESGTITLGYASQTISDVIVESCIISDTNVGGVGYDNPAHIRISFGGFVRNATFRDCEIYGPDAAGFKIDGRACTNITISHNYIHNAVHGIAVKWGNNLNDNIQLSYNIIRDCSGVGFYNNQANVFFEHNLVYNIGNSGVRWGDMEYITEKVQLLHNTFYNCGYGIIHDYWNFNPAGVMRNNLLIQPGPSSLLPLSIWPYVASSLPHGTTVANNGYYNAASSQVIREYGVGYTYAEWAAHFPADNASKQVFSMDKIFVDPANGRFELVSNSPFKNAASDGTDMGADMALVGIQGGPVNSFAEWRAQFFLGADLSNDAVSGPAADPDGTGVTNFQRYAHALAARGIIANPVTLGTVDSAGLRYLTLSFNRRAVATGLSYIVEASSDLIIWTPVPGQAFAAGSPTRVTAQDTVAVAPPGVPRRFLRLRIVTP